ncbi:hypothetical protein VN12_15025 [Pirellula sp. SH-Sr6A]|uniref:hypothetical protein n=1 Tax=Pirellula sp. SH-Sr6A TaxID=1632865 RepID=UPI00078D30C1|nr:hypothetical protein [Pirellula sp. SH-Sr6A]AMV33437.1 hypothetical protein VN12_15025 [Pirellula sp. SH-Sr6A]
MSPTQGTTSLRHSGHREWIRVALLGAIPFGLALSNQSSAQQPPAWSPQPYARPAASADTTPANSLRSGNAAEANAVARWRKVEKGPAQKPASYSQSLAPQTNAAAPQPSLQSIPESELQSTSFKPVARRQPVTPANRITDQAIQPASTHAAATNRRAQGVRLATYQDAAPTQDLLSLPPAPQGLPSAPSNPLPSLDSEPQSLLPKQETAPMPMPLQSPSDRSLRGNDLSLGSDNATSQPFVRPSSRAMADCDSLRQALSASDITKISVDTSPTFVEGYKNERATNSKDAFIQQAPQRPWYSLAGEVVAEGRLVDLAYGSVVIEQNDGTRSTFLLNRLSDADQIYVAEAWGIPATCSLNDTSLDPRNFIATTMTWKASGACHKPLYFEEVQLERYGHEWGPWAQPAISSLNFFKNVAVLPYKMGIHPMNECQYSLGYYRPGSCAPWTVGPVPISLRGAAVQAAAVTGAVFALP